MGHTLPHFLRGKQYAFRKDYVPSSRRQIPYPYRRRCLDRCEIPSNRPAVMSTTDPAFLAFLEAQRADYRSSLPQRMVQIESLWRQVLNDEAPAQALASLERC